jgi:hypothetical protein
MRKSILNRFNKLSKFNNQAGEGLSSVIVGLIGTLLTAIVLLLVVVMVTIPMPGKSLGNGDGTGGGKLAKGDTNNLPTDPNTNNLPINTDTNNLPTKEDNQDSATAYLVCVFLPGIEFPSPRTPALDRRVAEMWLAVRKDLEKRGIDQLRFSWAFRTNCQQVNVKPSINPNNRTGHNSKAVAGRSPHEAGRALDVRDMTRRKDAREIVATFNQHGWRWLGVTDPPHFEVLGYRVGEANHASWIRKIQQSYKQGYPKQGCRGSECGE